MRNFAPVKSHEPSGAAAAARAAQDVLVVDFPAVLATLGLASLTDVTLPLE